MAWASAVMRAWSLCMLVLVEEEGVAFVPLKEGGVIFQCDCKSILTPVSSNEGVASIPTGPSKGRRCGLCQSLQ